MTIQAEHKLLKLLPLAYHHSHFLATTLDVTADLSTGKLSTYVAELYPKWLLTKLNSLLDKFSLYWMTLT